MQGYQMWLEVEKLSKMSRDITTKESNDNNNLSPDGLKKKECKQKQEAG